MMKLMKLSQEDKVKILEYKFVFEEEIQVNNEYLEGSADLNYRLSFFRTKLDKTEASNNQKQKFDHIFMPDKKNFSSDTDLVNTDKQETAKSANKFRDDTKPWAKDLYKKIIMVTHPDKTRGVVSKTLIDKLTEQYRIAQNGYNTGNYSDLVMVAFDLNIDIPTKVILEEVSPECNVKKKKILSTKKMLAWQWYHVPASQKDAELKKILKHLGFSFSEEKVKEVVKRKYVKRKTGTRPKKVINRRRKITKH